MKIVALLAGLFLFALGANATHIIGGEMHYEYLGSDAAGNDSFKLVLKVYRDCNPGNAAFDNPVTIAIYNYSGTTPVLYTSIDIFIPTVGTDTLNNDTGNPCLTVPPNICVEEVLYQTTVVLPPSPGGYDICWQRCCRNNTILNILDPGDTGSSYVAHIPGTDNSQNSDPLFNLFPPTVICNGYALEFDHSATDLDGDSLVYELCAPYVGGDAAVPTPIPPAPPPYAFVSYAGSYNALYPLDASPAISIDPATGFLTGFPTAIGQYVVGICVKEYRDGVLLSEHKRDFQFNVANCSQVTAEIVAPPAPGVNYQFVDCAHFTVDFPNNSTQDANYFWDFGVIGVDTDTSTLVSPMYTYPDTGIYTVTLIVNPGLLCSDTAYADVVLYDTLYAYAGPDTIICPGQSVQLWSTGGITFEWTSSSSGSTLSNTTISNPVASPTETTIYTVLSTLGICSASAAVQIQVLPVPTLTLVDDLTICPDDSVQLLPVGTGQFSWTPTNSLSDPNAQNPWASPDETTLYHLTVTDNTSCVPVLYDSVLVSVLTNYAGVSPETTIVLGTSADISAFGADSYSWSPAEGLSATDISNPVATPTVTTTYTVLMTFANGCTQTKEVIVNVNPDPQLNFPNAFTPNQDGLNDLFRPYYLGFVTVDAFKVFNRWGQLVYDSKSLDGWDGKMDGEEQEVGTYAYIFTCRGTMTGNPFTYQGNVTLVR